MGMDADRMDIQARLSRLEAALGALQAQCDSHAGGDPLGSSPESYLSVREAAALFRVRRETVYRWLSRHNLPQVRCGRLVLIPRAALRGLVARIPGVADNAVGRVLAEELGIAPWAEGRGPNGARLGAGKPKGAQDGEEGERES